MKLFLFLFSCLLLPVGLLVQSNGQVIQTLPMLLSSAGIALFLYALFALTRQFNARLASGLLIILLLVALLIRFLLGFLYDFSGRGFTGEFFNHLNVTALNVGLDEYRNEGFVLLILLLLIVGITHILCKKQPALPKASAMTIMVAALTCFFLGAQAAPEYLLSKAYQRYAFSNKEHHHPDKSSIREQAKALLAPLRANTPLPLEKSQLQASLPAQPLNLILIYLESFNYQLTENERFPGLTPAIDQLKQQYHSFDNIYASAYVTIEGIANSQCGTLMNMEYANNSLITKAGRLPALPCLGDILHSAGYQQVFMGGADLEFAGKGAFLRDHGYDQLYGVKHWDKLGFKRVANWGLADTDLFEQALIAIEDLHRQNQPFNFTLLTLGMHIPGFQYEGCPSYTTQKEKQFLNAIHCTDYLLGEFMRALGKTDVLDDTVVLIQADHGVFASKDMRALFAKDFPDRRLLTLLALPENINKTDLHLNLRSPGSSVDLVASVLDLLQISHNTEFIFAQSHFQPATRRDYFLSRRTDQYFGQIINNTPDQCTEQAPLEHLTPPLDDCEKRDAMRMIAALNASYTQATVADNNICELGAAIFQNPKSGAIEIKWGNQNLSEQFYWRGIKKRKHQQQGIYAVIMDQHNNVQHAQFYQANSVQDAEAFKQALAGRNKRKVLLINNTTAKPIAPALQQFVADSLTDQKIIYGELNNGRLQIEFASPNLQQGQQFVPKECDSPEDD